MARPKIRTMHLNGPAEGELFMKREGVDPTGDDEPEWLMNERGFEEPGAADPGDEDSDDYDDDEDLDDEADDDEEED